MIKNKILKIIKWQLSSEEKCPNCNHYSLIDELSDDYWICRICGYAEDRINGQKYYPKEKEMIN